MVHDTNFQILTLILTQYYMKRYLLLLVFLILPVLFSFTPQESKVNQKKIEREREKKKKLAKKQYDQAVLRHRKMQSKDTKARMKQTRKSAKKSTPLSR